MTIHRYEFPNSSMLASCEYNDADKELSIEFNNGRIYTYVDVPKDTYDSLLNAKSAGSYFNSIKKELKVK